MRLGSCFHEDMSFLSLGPQADPIRTEPIPPAHRHELLTFSQSRKWVKTEKVVPPGVEFREVLVRWWGNLCVCVCAVVRRGLAYPGTWCDAIFFVMSYIAQAEWKIC